MSRRKYLATAVFALALAAPGLAAAQAAPALKIGVVSLTRLIQGSPQAAAMRKALQEEFAPRERDLLAKQTELKARGEKLQKDMQVMGAEERRSAESKFREDERDLQRRASEFQEDANVRQNEEINKLQRDLVREVQEYAKQNGYDLILADGVVFAGPTVDITAAVLTRVEANFKAKATGTP